MQLLLLPSIWLSIVTCVLFTVDVEAICKIKISLKQVIVNCDQQSLTDFPVNDIPLNVTDLYLRYNNLNSFNGSDLSEYLQLVNLYLTHNLFTDIPLIVSTKLAKLIIDSNRITNLNFPEHFKCPLREITLSSNPIQNITSDAFRSVPDLQTLTLNNCPLDFIDSNAFQSATNLRRLSMRQCGHLAGGSFLTAFLTLTPLRNLISLDLTNSFPSQESLTKDVFNGFYKETLQYLFLDGNNFVSIQSESFATLINLNTLSLRGSKISRLETRVFAGMSELTRLDISGNMFEALPSNCFEGSVKLATLLISDCNRLTSIESDAFAGMTSLNTLMMDGLTSMTTLPDMVFTGLDSLKNLSMASGNLNFIARGALSPFKRSLQTLDVSSQQLTDFTGADNISESFYNFTALKHLNILGNPFNCSCIVIAPFLSWLNETQIDVQNKTLLTCASPNSMKNVFLINVDCSIPTGTSWGIYLLIIISCSVLAVCGVVASVFLTKKYFKSRSPSNRDGMDPLLSTDYAGDQPPKRGLTNCFELITLAFTRISAPRTSDHTHDVENVFDETTEESNDPILPPAVATNFNANVLLVCHSDDAGWARSLRTQLSQRLPQGHQCKLIAGADCLCQETLTQPEHLLIILSISLIRAQTNVEMFNILISHITARHSHILIRKPSNVIRESLTEQAKRTGVRTDFADLSENEWIRCDGEAEMESIVELVRSHLSVA